MTRKHFEGIAECLRDVKDQIDKEEMSSEKRNYELMHAHICHILAARLQGFNKNFNVDRFLKDCGIPKEE